MAESSTKENKHVTLKEFLTDAPKWFHTAITIISVAFSAGILYSNVHDNTRRIGSLEGNTKPIPAEVSALKEQISGYKEAQNSIAQSTDKLAQSVDNLSISVAKLQGRLAERDNQRRNK